jgi:hypothetical protein
VWQVEYTDQFEQWWDKLSMEEQAAIDVTVEVLQERGPGLGRPHGGRRSCWWEGTSAIAGVPGTER